MSDDGTGDVFNLGAGDFEGLVVSLIITVITLVLCLLCTLMICLVRCFLSSDNGTGQLFSGGSTLHRSPNGRVGVMRDEENQQEEEEEEEGEGTREWDLAEAPPPSYGHVKEYQNVDLEHAEVVRLKQSVYRLSGHVEPEEVSLPPDYVSNRGEDEELERVSLALQDRLPPTYSTAQMELMARRTANELDTHREMAEMSAPGEESELARTSEVFQLRSETPAGETVDTAMQY